MTTFSCKTVKGLVRSAGSTRRWRSERTWSGAWSLSSTSGWPRRTGTASSTAAARPTCRWAARRAWPHRHDPGQSARCGNEEPCGTDHRLAHLASVTCRAFAMFRDVLDGRTQRCAGGRERSPPRCARRWHACYWRRTRCSCRGSETLRWVPDCLAPGAVLVTYIPPDCLRKHCLCARTLSV